MTNMIGIFAVAVALGLDAFSIALGLGLSGAASRGFKARFIGTVAVLHVAMPLLGLYLGLAAGNFLGRWAAVAGALVLAYIGFEMIRKGIGQEQVTARFGEAHKLMRQEPQVSVAGWTSVLVLALSVSMDALAVGFSLGTTRVPILYTVITTGTVAGVMTGLGWLGGKYFSTLMGKKAQAVGGGLLILLAIKMLL